MKARKKKIIKDKVPTLAYTKLVRASERRENCDTILCTHEATFLYDARRVIDQLSTCLATRKTYAAHLNYAYMYVRSRANPLGERIIAARPFVLPQREIIRLAGIRRCRRRGQGATMRICTGERRDWIWSLRVYAESRNSGRMQMWIFLTLTEECLKKFLFIFHSKKYYYFY